MNPITQTKNQNIMNERELRLGYTGTESSWHRQYKDSAWIFVGGLSYDLTEGDIICVFSQYGEIANVNLVRDKETGRSKGFAFVCYENQKSTVLATDNLNGIKLAGRTIRVDHVEKYRVPVAGTLKVGHQDSNQVPTGVGAGEYSSVSDYVREHGCGPKAMQTILQLQKANMSQGSTQSNGSCVDRSPSPPRGSRHRPSQGLTYLKKEPHSGSLSYRMPETSPRERRPSNRVRSRVDQRSARSPRPADISPPRRRPEASPSHKRRPNSNYSPHHSRHRERSRSSSNSHR